MNRTWHSINGGSLEITSSGSVEMQRICQSDKLLWISYHQASRNFKFDYLHKTCHIPYSLYSIACLSVFFVVSLYPINVKGWTDRAKICCGTSGKVYEWSKFKKFVRLKVFDFCKKKLNFENPRFIFIKSAKLFFHCFSMFTMRTCSQLKSKMGSKRSKSNYSSIYWTYSIYLVDNDIKTEHSC